MNLVLFDDYLLSRIFEKLRSKELVATAALVCKKWSKVVFTGNHRAFPPGLYSIFQEGLIEGNYRTYPLLGFRALCERNLLKEMEPNKQLMGFMTVNPFEGQRWVVTRNRGTVLEPMSVPVQSKTDEGNAIGEFSVYSTGIYEMTQVIDLQQRYIELGLTPELSIKVKDLCPELRLRFTALQFLQDSNSEVLIKMTVSMDDGTPVLAPYNNNMYTSYTRDAMFVKSVESNDNQLYTVRELDMRISGYPREAKRLIVSIRGHFENAHLAYCKPTLLVSKARVQTSSQH